jgi:hypothetical protein
MIPVQVDAVFLMVNGILKPKPIKPCIHACVCVCVMEVCDSENKTHYMSFKIPTTIKKSERKKKDRNYVTICGI